MQDSTNLTFDDLVRRFRTPMTRAAYHLCGDLESACDIVQETFLDAYRGFDKLRHPDRVAAWLYAILRRRAATYRRSRRTEVELSEYNMPAVPADTGSVVREIVVEQMSRLDAEDREILAGKYLIGLSYRELAESLGMKEVTVRVRCLRAKERLREILRGAGVSVPEKR